MTDTDINIEFAPLPTALNFIDLSGCAFHRLTVLGYLGYTPFDSKPQWLVKCSCGTQKSVRGDHLRAGAIKSCGCLRHEIATNLRHGMSDTSEYKIFIGAKKRCTDPTSNRYAAYHDRGIEFRFATFEEFYAEIGPRPSLAHSLERIDNNGPYESGNVKWATIAEQTRNRRSNVFLTANGVTRCREDWAVEIGRPVSTLVRRQAKGWCDECTLLLPNFEKCPHITK